MAGKKPISQSDSDLFREAVGDVRPVNNDRVASSRPKPAARPRATQDDNANVMRELMSDFSEIDLIETGEHVGFTRPGVQRRVLRNLKSGKYAIQGELDLHGYTEAEARDQVLLFLRESGERQHTCVRIIHGRGRKIAAKSPVLKPAVAIWLQRHKRVLAFCSARENDGGTGAVYVLLQK